MLEYRFPVLLEDFHIRRGSGGKGQWNAGDGTSRTIRFLQDDGMRHALVAPHRPAVRHRGRRARRTRPHLRPAAGWRHRRARAACDQTVLKAGEAVTVITPTGGGFGDKAKRDA